MLLLIITMGACNELKTSKFLILQEKSASRYKELSFDARFKLSIINEALSKNTPLYQELRSQITSIDIDEFYEKLMALAIYKDISEIDKAKGEELAKMKSTDIVLDYKNIISKYADIVINDILSKYEDKLTKEEKAKLDKMSQIDTLSYLLALNKLGELEETAKIKGVDVSKILSANSSPIEKYVLIKEKIDSNKEKS